MGNLTITATGDSLFVAPLPSEYETDLNEIRSYLAAGEVRITNLETNLGPFGDFASAYSGGTWLNTEEAAFLDLMKYGFNYYGTANNHSMDYSYHALRSTNAILDKYRLAHSGTGESLAEAGRAAEIGTKEGKVGVIAVTTTFEKASQAGVASLGSKARPGVNFVRPKQYTVVGKDDLQTLREIAARSGINDARDREVADGFLPPDADGTFTFGKTVFTTPDGKRSECNAKDLARLTDSIGAAKEKYTAVVVLIHSHEGEGAATDVPQFLEELAHACIDAGASAIIGGGCHRLRPMELYRGFPIFYSLGDFIYQGMEVKYLPADFMEAYGIPANSTAWEGLMARSRGNRIGLQTKICNYRTVIPKMTFGADGKLTELELLPVELGFSRKDRRNGLPAAARGEEAETIFCELRSLSERYKVGMELRGGVIAVALS